MFGEKLITHRGGRDLLHVDIQNRNTLLICVGDSWTWGDSLGKIGIQNGVFDDKQWRLDHIYGSLLSKKLESDFINYGIPGGSNSEIIDSLFLNILPVVYKNNQRIIVVITLTELCREIISDPVWANALTEFSSIESILEQYESLMLSSLSRYQQSFPNAKIIVARNFTYTFPSNQSLVSNHLDKIWIDTLKLSENNKYPTNLRILDNQGMLPLQKYLKQQNLYQKYKSEYVDLLGRGLDAIDWLDESPYNSKFATRHPIEQGHKLWADYLYNYCL